MNTILLVTGAFAAAVVSAIVLVEYLVLVPLSRNPGAKRLAGLLLAVWSLCTVTILRYYFQDWPFREEVLTLLFWTLTLSLGYLGWHIWKDQIEGARKYRQQHPHHTPPPKE